VEGENRLRVLEVALDQAVRPEIQQNQ